MYGLELLRQRAKAPYSAENGLTSAIDFYEIATQAFNKMDDPNRTRLYNFAAGINSFKFESPLLPTEFYTQGLGGKFEDWSPIDSLAILKYVHW